MLVQKGYQPNFSGELLGAIWLYHPRESFEHKRLILYGSGLVVSVNDKSDKYRFGSEETQVFNKFLQTIPTPSFWEHTRRGRINVYAWLMICGVMLGGGLFGTHRGRIGETALAIKLPCNRSVLGRSAFQDADKKPQFAIVSVKGGGIKSGDVRDLKGTMDREKSALGLFLSLTPPLGKWKRKLHQPVSMRLEE